MANAHVDISRVAIKKLVRNLREHNWISWAQGMEVAAETIVALEAEVAKLRQDVAEVFSHYPEFEDDLDETACPTGWVTCPVCQGGGSRDGRHRSPIKHVEGCINARLRAAIAYDGTDTGAPT